MSCCMKNPNEDQMFGYDPLALEECSVIAVIYSEYGCMEYVTMTLVTLSLHDENHVINYLTQRMNKE